MAELSDISNKVISRNLDNFFDSIDIFVSKPKFGAEIGDLFSEGLKVFLKVTVTKSVSIHLMDESDFTFQHRLTLPAKFSQRALENFDYLINEGFIGKSLNEGKFFFLDKSDNKQNVSFVIIPMIASWGVMGIIIVELEDDIDEFDNYFTKLFQLHTNILSSAIERVQLFDKMKMQNSMLEQKVALRTHRLNQSQNEIKAVFNATQTGIFVCNDSNKIVNHNEEAFKILEADDGIIGIDLMGLLNFVDSEFEAELTTLKDRKLDVLINKKETQVLDQTLTVYSVLDISSRKIAQRALIELNKNLESIVNQRTEDLEETVKKLEKEIDERYKAEQEIKNMLEQEKELNTLKSKFIKTVSHEFRTPLTVIRSAAQLLEVYGDQISSEDKTKYVNRVINTVDFLTQLIENVLNLGNTTGSGGSKNIINLSEYFNDLLANQLNYLESNVKLDINKDINVYGNKQSLNVIFNNLIANANKYKFDNTLIDITASKDDGKVIISVENEGIGIPAKDKSRVFDLFYRGENIGNITGIGIGLSVVKQCINLLDGSINFESEENKKTVFTIELKSPDVK